MSSTPDRLTHRQTLKDRATQLLRSRSGAFIMQYSPPPILSRCFACVKKIKISLGLQIMEVVFIGPKERKKMFLDGDLLFICNIPTRPWALFYFVIFAKSIKTGTLFTIHSILSNFQNRDPKEENQGNCWWISGDRIDPGIVFCWNRPPMECEKKVSFS